MTSLLLSLAFAQTPPPLTAAPGMEPQPYPTHTEPQLTEPQPIPNNFSLYITLIEPTIAVLGAVVPGAATQVASVGVRLGGVFGGRHALLFGLAGSFFTVTGGNVLLGTIAPQYRIHFRPLVVGSLAPFLQIEGVLGFLLAPGSTGSTAAVLGFGPGFGCEMLFTKNFGLTGAVGGRLSYLAAATGVLSATLWAAAALAFHF
jgi:hypothetical protein